MSIELMRNNPWVSQNKKRVWYLLTLGAVLVIYGWSAVGTNLSITQLVTGIPSMLDLISRMLPPNWDVTGKIIQATIETIQIAIWGTTLAVLLAIPLGLLAARNISPHPVIYASARCILNALRSISELIFALIFVVAVGLGPFPGVLALAFHSAGQLGKFYAESIENIDPGPVDALRATGAHTIQVIRYGIVPQIIPEFVTFSLYRWESDVRAASILGMVGAGGLGLELMASMRLFQYQDTAMILVVIMVTVTMVDYISTKIRAKII